MVASKRTRRDRGVGRFTWIGDLESSSGHAILVVNGDRLAASVRVGDRLFRILYAGEGIHTLREIDLQSFHPEEEPFEEDDPLPIPSEAFAEGAKPVVTVVVAASTERLDRQVASLRAYYAAGPAEDWQDKHISAYASSHPWEDFAETWGHYITIADTLETASEFGFSTSQPDPALTETFDSYNAPTFDAMLERWLPLTFAVNNINRSGGRPDLYPFVLSATVIEKLRYVHSLIRQSA